MNEVYEGRLVRICYEKALWESSTLKFMSSQDITKCFGMRQGQSDRQGFMGHQTAFWMIDSSPCSGVDPLGAPAANHLSKR
uniref:Uncharacterized protein n=1 Tax=Arundo donax TaxID=35708 RepID=A0A0A9HJJ9_ARUDO